MTAQGTMDTGVFLTHTDIPDLHHILFLSTDRKNWVYTTARYCVLCWSVQAFTCLRDLHVA